MALPRFREALANEYNIGYGHFAGVLKLFKISFLHRLHVVAKYGVMELNVFAQVSVYDKCRVVFSELTLPGYFYLHHTELVSGSCSRGCEVKVDIFNV